MLGMSLSHFQRHVQPQLRCVRSGQLRLYRPHELERWLEGAVSARTGEQPLIACDGTTTRIRSVTEARDARCSPHDPPRRGEVAVGAGKNITLEEVRERFIRGASEGVALNKWRRPYRPRSVEDLESLNQLPPEMLCRHVDWVTRGEVQELVDELSRRGRSASRISSVVNALRSLYRFAQERELAAHDPAQEVRLPLGNPTVHNRVASPAEFDRLLNALWDQTPEEIEEGKKRNPRNALKEALPYALAAYGTARAQEIEVLDWQHVDLELGGGEFAGEEAGRKPGGSWRVVPYVKPLWDLLREEWLAQGKPSQGKVCPPERIRKSRRKSMQNLQRRVRRRWQAQDLDPIGLQEARHTAATWFDHAGVSPKVASQMMGHKTPAYQPGAARITLECYTHVLPGELERARGLLDEFIEERRSGARPGSEPRSDSL
jgi:integrase